ncbi:MAG TPA: hypothetical protein VEI06_17820 [Gemmatimonadaceae bacterium]|nr:hypothetical protein [Gemmatimonadaceae bacterium]
MSASDDSGRAVTRREAIAILGAAGAAAALGGATSSIEAMIPGPGAPACVLTPALEEGPFFVDEKLKRSDLVAGSSNPLVLQGLPLTLALTVVKVAPGGCTPLAGAYVDVWQAHAGGKYSDEAREGTVGEKYLRGYQVTDAAGLVTFKSIYPGWYPGRTVHTHVMIRLMSSGGRQAIKYETQLFYDPALTTQVLSRAPYNARGAADTVNGTDHIYADSQGRTIVTLVPVKAGSGFTGAFTLGIQGG